MKKLLVLALVLAMAPLANAVVIIDAGATTVNPGESTAIGVEVQDTAIAEGQYVLGIDTGSTATGSLDISAAVIDYIIASGDPIASNVTIFDDAEALGGFNLRNLAVSMVFADTVAPSAPVLGQLISAIQLNVGAEAGELNLRLVCFAGDDFGMDYASQIITVPEPITMGLLGLGGLMLRRRK
jgi:hypothetical protein